MASEIRALKADSDTQGGYLLQNELLGIMQNLANFASPISRLSNFTPVSTYEASWPTLTTRPSAAQWLPDGWAIMEDSATRIGSETHVLHRLTKLGQVSNKLLRSSFAEKSVLAILGIAKGVAQETAYLSGSGTGEPVGILKDPNLLEYESIESGSVQAIDIFDFSGALPNSYRENAAIVTTVDFWKEMIKLDNPRINSWKNFLDIPFSSATECQKF